MERFVLSIFNCCSIPKYSYERTHTSRSLLVVEFVTCFERSPILDFVRVEYSTISGATSKRPAGSRREPRPISHRTEREIRSPCFSTLPHHRGVEFFFVTIQEQELLGWDCLFKPMRHLCVLQTWCITLIMFAEAERARPCALRRPPVSPSTNK